MEQLRLFLKNPMIREMLNKPDPMSGKTLLEICFSSNNIEAAKLILDAGANISQHNSDQDSPLMVAIKNNKPEVVSFICDLMRGNQEKILLIVDTFFYEANSREMLLCLFKQNNLAFETILKINNPDFNKYEKVLLTGDDNPIIANKLLLHAVKSKNTERVSMLMDFFITRIKKLAEYRLLNKPISALFNKFITVLNLENVSRKLSVEEQIEYLINAQDENSKLTPLEVASIQGDTSMIEVLVKYGAKLTGDSQSAIQASSIIHLLYDSRFSIKIKELLFHLFFCSTYSENNFSREDLLTYESHIPNDFDSHSYPFLYHLLKQGTASMLKDFLSQFKPEKVKTILNKLIKTSEFLAESSTIVSGESPPETTLLHLAAMMNDFEKVQTLLSFGTDINKTDGKEVTALQVTKNSDITLFLLDNGAIGNQHLIEQAIHDTVTEMTIVKKIEQQNKNVDKNKRAFLEVELYFLTGGKGAGNSLQRLKHLLTRNDTNELFNPELVNKLFSLANDMKELTLVKLLLSRCDNINKKNLNGETLLHIAVKFNNIDMIELILNAGANKEVQNNNLQTPADLAHALGYSKLYENLKLPIIEVNEDNNIEEQNRDSLLYALLENAEKVKDKFDNMYLSLTNLFADDFNEEIDSLDEKTKLTSDDKGFSSVFSHQAQQYKLRAKEQQEEKLFIKFF